MISLSDLPAANAMLNTASAVLLVTGYTFIRCKKVTAHLVCMGSALMVSTLFLISYLVYHYHEGSTPFTGQGWVRGVYFSMLITHAVLAAMILPLALTTLCRAWKKQFDRHVRIARWTLPIWLYVSVTGVAIYLMLYQWYAPE